MLRVKINTFDGEEYLVEDATNYLNAVNIIENSINHKIDVAKICHVDDYNEELDIIEFTKGN